MDIVLKYLPKYTIEDYKKWEGDWELIEGIPYAMAPSPFGKHQEIISNLIIQIFESIKNCPEKCKIYPELDWIISENTVLRPDLIVICKKIEFYLKEAPEVVIEVVSKSTAEKDEYIKYDIYQREKVPFYILVYPDIEKVRVFNLVNNKYEKYFDSDEGILKTTLKNGCDINIDVKALFS